MPSSVDDHSKASDPQIFWSTFVQPRLVQTERVLPRDKNGAVRARRALDAELSAMHLAMCSIRTRYNGLVPISVLPVEALARIFHFHAANSPPGSHEQHPLGWIEVTHVCRHWRDTALQFPNLWVDVSYTLGSKWGKTMLKRAKAAPISLRRDVTGASQSSLNRICEHFPHTRELMLVGPPAVLKSAIDALPPPPAILETMAVGPADTKAFKGPSFELAGAIAACRFPSLRHLALRALSVPWSAPILCGLRYLELQLYYPHNPSAGGYPSSSWGMLFGALRNMPDLENLILKDCYPSGPCEDAGHDILQLPRLRVLQLQGLSSPCFGIAARLQIPPSCQVQLRGRDAEDIAEILPFLTTHFHDGVNLPPWYTLSITRRRHRFQVEMWRSSDDLNEEEDCYNPKTTADLAIWYHSTQSVLDSLKALFQTLPLHTMLTLCIRVDCDISDEAWVDLLGRCTNVTTASVVGPWGTSFCSALGVIKDHALAASSADGAHGTLFLESLEYLRLSGTDFSNWRWWRWDYDRNEDWDVDDLTLMEWLTARKTVDADSELELDLKGCSVRREWVQKLRAEARRVDWDEDEGMIDVEDEIYESEESDSSLDW